MLLNFPDSTHKTEARQLRFTNKSTADARSKGSMKVNHRSRVQRYEFILINSKIARKYCCFRLEEDFHAVELEDTALAGLADLIGVEKLKLASALVVVVLDADAASPLLDLALGGPELDVNWLGTIKDESCGRNVD